MFKHSKQGCLVKIQAEVLGSKTLTELSHLKPKVSHGGGERYLGKMHKGKLRRFC